MILCAQFTQHVSHPGITGCMVVWTGCMKVYVFIYSLIFIGQVHKTRNKSLYSVLEFITIPGRDVLLP